MLQGPHIIKKQSITRPIRLFKNASKAAEGYQKNKKTLA